ncbi:MAG TPA: hypothetical protein VME40_20365 [Caulobacteraceae bacterium]|nr:hypothetical protein [Caulobacteraceae bacterium]
MSDPPAPVVLGFRPHTYWTSAVAVRGAATDPEVVVRHKIVFAAGDERSVYHQAAEATAGAAEALIETVRGAVVANARAGIERLLALLARDGLAVGVASVPTGGKTLPPLADIVRVHTLQHAAEGEFYRDAVAAACASLGLEVRRPVERELIALTCGRLAITRNALDAELKALAAKLGPPWSEDQRLAMLAARLELPPA